MKCRDVAPKSSAFVDGDLPPTARWRIRLHLLRCTHCARFVRQIGLTRRVLREAGPPPLDPTREDELAAALRRGGGPREGS